MADKTIITMLIISNLITIFERIAMATPESWKPFGMPVGKYDGHIIKIIKDIFLGIKGKQ